MSFRVESMPGSKNRQLSAFMSLEFPKLYLPVADAAFVHVVEGNEDLSENVGRGPLFHRSILDQGDVELAAGAVLEDEVEFLDVVEPFVELHDVRVVLHGRRRTLAEYEAAKKFDFAFDGGEVAVVLHLVDDLDGHCGVC